MAKYLETVGRFNCVVEKPEAGWFGESKEKQTPFIRVPVKVIDGPCAGQVGTWTGWLSENTMDNTIARLAEVFGFDGDLHALHVGKTSLVGLKCSVETEAETYNGKSRIRVQWLNKFGSGPKAEPLAQAKVDALLAKITSRAKAVAKANLPAGGAVATPAAPTAPETPEDDDVPF